MSSKNKGGNRAPVPTQPRPTETKQLPRQRTTDGDSLGKRADIVLTRPAPTPPPKK